MGIFADIERSAHSEELKEDEVLTKLSTFKWLQ